MQKKYDLITMGQLLLRLSPPGSERLMNCEMFEKQVGGAELNVAAGASQLGLSTGIISKLPVNDIGIFIRNKIRSYGVGNELLVYDQSKGARMGIYFYEGGAYPKKPKIFYDRNNSSFHSLKIGEIPEEIYGQARCFHTTGITLALSREICSTAVEIMKRFKDAGTMISFDVNYRSNLWTGEQARVCIEEILPLVDIFFCSEDTAKLTFKRNGTLKEIMKGFAEDYRIAVVASTQRIVHSPRNHTFGSVIYETEKDTFYEEEPYRDIEIVDRIGSGDAYISGVLYGFLNGGMDCRKALQYGDAACALKNTIPGDLLISDLSETDAVIKGHQQNAEQIEMVR